jgi:putative NADH-flavin reductase
MESAISKTPGTRTLHDDVEEGKAMKITVFGARGRVGRRIVAEALSRGHEVTAVVRDASQLSDLPAAAQGRVADAGNPLQVATVSTGQDVVVNATRPAAGDEGSVAATTKGLLEGLSRSGARLLVVGGAATLVVPGSGGKTVLQDPRYLPIRARHVAEASARQLQVCLAAPRVDWAYLSPAAQLAAGERTGRYRVGGNELLVDGEGNSRISIEDLAVALIDEAERPRHHRERFTVAY